jgi:hypothetical protein
MLQIASEFLEKLQIFAASLPIIGLTPVFADVQLPICLGSIALCELTNHFTKVQQC